MEDKLYLNVHPLKIRCIINVDDLIAIFRTTLMNPGFIPTVGL